MKTKLKALLTVSAIAAKAFAEPFIPGSAAEDKNNVMSDKYWEIWNPQVQEQIDRDIEANRKADASVKLDGADEKTQVQIEQISHDFIFGAHIFNFNQLGDESLNAKYRSLYGSLFNSATVAFYWEHFEMQQGRPRFAGEFWDSEKYWKNSESPKTEEHWRRPAPDPVIDYCKSQGIRVHGHPLVWGSRSWHTPTWMLKSCAKGEEAEKLKTLIAEFPKHGNKCYGEKYTKKYKEMSAKDLGNYLPNLAAEMKRLTQKRINEIAAYYGDKVDSWDVVNESATDWGKGLIVKGDSICKSWYGMMPGDYPYLAFQTAQNAFPQNVKLNINDYKCDGDYTSEIKDLLSRGCKVDIVGSQMHLFNPKQTLAIAEGKEIQTPQQVQKTMDAINVGKPIHLSEITITAPDTTEKGKMMQAIIARNLYRKWFSIKPMMGITWWNVVDDCGAPGEPSMSGLFTRGMNPKPAYYALNNLINKEWKTVLTQHASADGTVKFRGFKGKYRLSWKDKNGAERFAYVHVK